MANGQKWKWELTELPITGYATRKINGAITDQKVQNTSVKFWDYTNSMSNPYYRHLIAVGLNATTSRSGELHRCRVDPYNIKTRSKDPGFDVESESTGMLDLTGVDITAILDNDTTSGFFNDTRAVCGVNIRNSIAEARTKIQSLVIAAEAKKTINTVLRAGSEFITGFKKLRKKAFLLSQKKKNWGSHDDEMLREITDQYLNFQYGVKPLVADIDGGMQVIANMINKPLGTPVSGRAVDYRNRKVETITDCWGYHTYPVTFIGGVRTSISVKSKGYLRLDLEPSLQTPSSLGLNLGSFVPSLYELIPYSFVVDYFTNLGDVITALCTSICGLGWSWTTGCIEQSFTGGLGVKPGAPVSTANSSYSYSGGRFEFSRKKFTRDGSIPSITALSGFRFELPNIQQGVNSLMLALSKL